jgi:N-acyl-D-aspartate/D-glutamate deacylase
VTALDLVIRGGAVVDGTGQPSMRADVAVREGIIVEVGRVRERGAEEIDADGLVVTPGFVDGHTHMDAQVFWDPYGSSSCWHGVTTVVMGNCGFTLAPARPDERALVVRNLERAEDISPAALAAGIDWTWETYGEYLDAVDRRPKSINYAGQVGHSALRTWAMGERAFTEPATDDDLAVMRQGLREALSAGAIGFTTSRSDTHRTSDDRPVASLIASWDEIHALIESLREFHGRRLFQLSVDTAASDPDPAVRQVVFDRLRHIAVEQGVPVTFGIISPGDEYRWRGLVDTIDATNAAGGNMFGQSLPREATLILSFQTRLPFDRLPQWGELRRRPVAEQLATLREPDARRRLVDEARRGPYVDSIGATIRPPDWDRIRVFDDAQGPNPTINEVAAGRGADPLDTFIDLAVNGDGSQFFTQAVGNIDQDAVLTMLRHPRMMPTFSDSGAHVGYIMESSIATYVLSYWVRRRQALTFEEAIRKLTLEPATAWGFSDRGQVHAGFVADLNVIDPATVGPGALKVEHDLPAGESRIKQGATGIHATIVGGQVVLEHGKHTGNLPGRLLRR